MEYIFVVICLKYREYKVTCCSMGVMSWKWVYEPCLAVLIGAMYFILDQNLVLDEVAIFFSVFYALKISWAEWKFEETSSSISECMRLTFSLTHP